MKTSLLLSTAVAACAAVSAPGSVIVQWDFNSATPDANTGTGTLVPAVSLVAGVPAAGLLSGNTSSFASGDASGGSTDPAAGDDSGWNVSTFAAQGAGDKTRGVQFLVDTTGYKDLVISWDQRHSNTSSRNVRFQYTTDGSTWTDSSTFVGGSGDTWFNNRSVDLSGIAAVENNANFGFRIVSEFGSGGAYEPSSPTATYGTTGTWRFDMVTLDAVVVPEPHEYAALAGLGLFGFAAWRRCRRA